MVLQQFGKSLTFVNTIKSIKMKYFEYISATKNNTTANDSEVQNRL